MVMFIRLRVILDSVIHVVELFTITEQTGLVRMHIRIVRRYYTVQYTNEMDNIRMNRNLKMKMKVGDDEDWKDTERE